MGSVVRAYGTVYKSLHLSFLSLHLRRTSCNNLRCLPNAVFMHLYMVLTSRSARHACYTHRSRSCDDLAQQFIYLLAAGLVLRSVEQSHPSALPRRDRRSPQLKSSHPARARAVDCNQPGSVCLAHAVALRQSAPPDSPQGVAQAAGQVISKHRKRMLPAGPARAVRVPPDRPASRRLHRQRPHVCSAGPARQTV